MTFPTPSAMPSKVAPATTAPGSTRAAQGAKKRSKKRFSRRTTAHRNPVTLSGLHQQILSALLQKKETVREETRFKLIHPIQDPKTYEAHKVKVPVPKLAGNVSNDNVERTAARWLVPRFRREPDGLR